MPTGAEKTDAVADKMRVMVEKRMIAVWFVVKVDASIK